MAQVSVNPNEDTEFHDALRAHGIIPPKPPSRSPSPDQPSEAEQRQEQLNGATLPEIDRALEADGLGSIGDEEERILLRLREQRLAAMSHERKRARFGRVYPITRPDYPREVTEASKEDPDADAEEDGDDHEDQRGKSDEQAKPRKGTGVVCFLYKDSIDTCRLLAGYLDTLAAKYPSTKFVSIVGDKCIPDYPDKNLPTLLVYRAGELHRQIVGLRPEIGLDGMKTTCADIELLLNAIGVLDRSNIPGHGAYGAGPNKADREDDDDSDRDTRNKRTTVRTIEEEDDDLDWDL